MKLWFPQNMGKLLSIPQPLVVLQEGHSSMGFVTLFIYNS
jgi:hypothetical protein